MSTNQASFPTTNWGVLKNLKGNDLVLRYCFGRRCSKRSFWSAMAIRYEATECFLWPPYGNTYSSRVGSTAATPRANAVSDPSAFPVLNMSCGYVSASHEANPVSQLASCSGKSRIPSTKITGRLLAKTMVLN